MWARIKLLNLLVGLSEGEIKSTSSITFWEPKCKKVYPRFRLFNDKLHDMDVRFNDLVVATKDILNIEDCIGKHLTKGVDFTKCLNALIGNDTAEQLGMYY
jgi:hypothetical protein